MFELAVRYLGDDEQVKQWLPLITKARIIGNYSQTELGHGSNVRVSYQSYIIIILYRGWRLRQFSTKTRTNSLYILQKIPLPSSGPAILDSPGHTALSMLS
jgi:hypothetical protein